MIPQQYPLVMRLLHWVMAIIIMGLIIVGFLMGNIWTDEPYTRDLFRWHKSFGVVALALIGLRIVIRLALNHRVPKLSAMRKKYEQVAAKTGHILWYVLMTAAPLSGYLMSSTQHGLAGIDWPVTRSL